MYGTSSGHLNMLRNSRDSTPFLGILGVPQQTQNVHTKPMKILMFHSCALAFAIFVMLGTFVCLSFASLSSQFLSVLSPFSPSVSLFPILIPSSLFAFLFWRPSPCPPSVTSHFSELTKKTAILKNSPRGAYTSAPRMRRDVGILIIERKKSHQI